MSNINNVIENPEDEFNPVTYVPEIESHGTKTVWNVFWLLLGLTLIDVAIYFTMPFSFSRHMIFILLGLIKSFYIVGYFMHMKSELKALILTILLPMVLVIYLITLYLQEATVLEVVNYM